MIYALLMLTAAATGLSKNFIFAKILGEVGLGYFSLLSLIGAYGAYLGNMGISDGLLRNLSILRGRGSDAEAVRLRNIGAFYILAISCTALIIFIITCIFLARDNTNLSVTYIFSGIFSLGYVLFLLATLELRTKNELISFGTALFAKAVISLTLGLAAAEFYGFKGVLAAETLTVYLLFALIVSFRIKDFRFSAGPYNELAETVRIGFPAMLSSLLRNVSTNMDRWFIAGSFGIAVFGQYSFAMLVPMAGLIAINIVNQYLGPILLRRYGQDENLANVLNSAWKISAMFIILGIMGFIPFRIIVDFAGTRFFGEYRLGISMMYITYMGTVIQTANIFDWVVTAKGNTKLLLCNNAVSTALVILLCFVGIYQNYPIIFFAWVYTVGRLANFSLSTFFALKTAFAK